MTVKTFPKPDEYRMPSDSDGAVEFAPDPKTAMEQVDFHLSSLDSLEQISRTAAELAMSAHPANPNELDQSRIEQPGGELAEIIPLAKRHQSEIGAQMSPHQAAKRYGQHIVFRRQEAINDPDSRKAA